MTKKELHERSGVSLRSISALENDPTPSPSLSTIEALAKALQVRVDFLNAGPIEVPAAEAASFRSMKSMSARLRDSALSHAAMAMQLATWVDERFELPEVSIPRLSDLSPEAAAEAVRAEWRLGNQPIGNVVHELEAHGVRVFSLDLHAKEVDAFSLWSDGTPFVFLNTFKTSERSRMDAAHELGHLVLHDGFDRSLAREIEREAAEFASAFLLPGLALRGQHRRFPDLTELIELKQTWNVALAAYVYRLHAIGEISDWHYRTLFKSLSRLGYRSREPVSAPRETSAVFTQVLDHLRRSGSGFDQMLDDLSISRGDLNSLVWNLALLEMDGGPAANRNPSTSRADLRVVKG